MNFLYWPATIIEMSKKKVVLDQMDHPVVMNRRNIEFASFRKS